MKKTIIRSLFQAIVVALLVLIKASSANAQITIGNIALSTPQDGKAQVTWTTNEMAKSDVYFGEKVDQLDRHVAYIEYRRSHTMDLTGLKKKTDYYYKIVVTSESGQKSESFVQYFNTNKMKDNIAPTIGGVKVLQATNKAAAIYFLTDEPTKTEIKYGLTQDNLDRKISDSSLQRMHLMIINNLIPGNRYYYKILAKDDDGNLAENGGDLVTDSVDGYDDIKVLNLIPSSNNQVPLLAERAVISWESSVLATADISYGIDPEKLNKNIKVSAGHQLNHQAELSGLTPSSTYYFQIKMSSKLNNKKVESQIYSFKTAPITLDYVSQSFRSGDIVVSGRDYYYLYGGGKIKLNNNSLVSRGYDKEVSKKIEEKYLKPYIDLPA
ncbi:MAG TPA: fibronectin type III domain-containing protein, partial [bacterium]|nr:fibronectin type III domain-containing protein [bacterium]